jgi:hypothetical protein
MQADIKRFIEAWTGDGNFEKRLLENEEAVLKKHNLTISKEVLRQLYDRENIQGFCNCNANMKDEDKPCRLLQKYKDKNAHKFVAEELDDRRLFSHWVKRQHNRNILQFSDREHLSYNYLSIELSKGCTNQCWFCSLCAPKYNGYYRYDREEWNSILKVLKQSLGDHIIRNNICYWASDPFDNPDYEKFLFDYNEIAGCNIHTRTASSTKDIKRTRAFIHKFQNVHFSVLNKRDLMILHQNFSTEELQDIKLYLQFNEICSEKMCAGRARDVKKEKRVGEFSWTLLGFLLNMVERKIALAMPAAIHDGRPCGGIILDERSFTSADDLQVIIKAMMKDNMINKLNRDDVIGLFPDFKIEFFKKGFKVVTPCKFVEYGKALWLEEFGKMFSERCYLFGEIIVKLKEKFGVTIDEIEGFVKDLFNDGLIDESLIVSSRKK